MDILWPMLEYVTYGKGIETVILLPRLYYSYDLTKYEIKNMLWHLRLK